jgi:hypothetical protein
MAATAVAALSLEEASVKIRAAGVSDEEEDYALGVWAGVLPMAVTFGDPETDPRAAGIPVPAHIRARAGEGQGSREYPFGKEKNVGF